MAGEQDADTPLARWLRERIGSMKLQEVSRRARRRGIKINASSLSSYLHTGIFPTPELVGRLAAYFGADPSEIEKMRPREEGALPLTGLPGLDLMQGVDVDEVADLFEDFARRLRETKARYDARPPDC